MSEYPLPRRKFLLRALTACGAALLGQPVFGQTGQRPGLGGADRGAGVAAGYLGSGSLDAARKIAQAYLTQMNIDRSDQAVIEEARTTLELISRTPQRNAAISALVASVRRDFLADRMIQVEGWVLSRTEVEICLLTFALPSRGLGVK